MKQKPERLHDYLRDQSACCKPSTVNAYQTQLAHFCNWLEIVLPTLSFNKQIEKLNTSLLRNYILYLNDKKLVPYSKVNYLLSVKKYLAWEVNRGTLNEEILEVLDRKHLPKVPEYLPRPLSSENDLILLSRLREANSPYASLFLLLRHTGMRISELINLPPDCVITTLKDEKYLKVPLGKMNTERLVPLTNETFELIEKIKNSPPLKMNRQDKNRLINLSGPVSSVYSLLSLRFKKIVGDLSDQQKNITFHRLRHTYATTLLTGGVGLVSLMKLLGHRRIEMTLRYAKVTPAHLRDEYFKAIHVLENQSEAAFSKNLTQTSGLYDPSDIIARLSSFVLKSSRLSTPHQKNLLRKLRTLQHDLSQITFSQKFTLEFSRDQQVVRWAG